MKPEQILRHEILMEATCQAPLQVHVSQTDGWLLIWMYTLQVTLKLVTNNIVVAAPFLWRLVATNWGTWCGDWSFPYLFFLSSWYLEVASSNPVTGTSLFPQSTSNVLMQQFHLRFRATFQPLCCFYICSTHSFLFNSYLHSPSVVSTSQPLIATCDQQRGHCVSRIYGVNGILIDLRTSRATEQTYQGLPPVVETPRHEVNLVRYRNVQFN